MTLSIVRRGGHVAERALATAAEGGGLSAGQQAHVDGCDACAALLEGHRRALRLLSGEWRGVPAVAAGGAAALPVGSVRPASRLRIRWLELVAGLAAVLAVVGVGVSLRSSIAGAGAGPVALPSIGSIPLPGISLSADQRAALAVLAFLAAFQSAWILALAVVGASRRWGDERVSRMSARPLILILVVTVLAFAGFEALPRGLLRVTGIDPGGDSMAARAAWGMSLWTYMAAVLIAATARARGASRSKAIGVAFGLSVTCLLSYYALILLLVPLPELLGWIAGAPAVFEMACFAPFYGIALRWLATLAAPATGAPAKPRAIPWLDVVGIGSALYIAVLLRDGLVAAHAAGVLALSDAQLALIQQLPTADLLALGAIVVCALIGRRLGRSDAFMLGAALLAGPIGYLDSKGMPHTLVIQTTTMASTVFAMVAASMATRRGDTLWRSVTRGTKLAFGFWLAAQPVAIFTAGTPVADVAVVPLFAAYVVVVRHFLRPPGQQNGGPEDRSAVGTPDDSGEPPEDVS